MSTLLFEPKATQWTARNALYFATTSSLAYVRDSVDFHDAMSSQLGLERIIPISIGSNQCFVAGDAEKVIVAFRGSEPPKDPDGLGDWLHDLDAAPVFLSNFVSNAPKNSFIHHSFASGANSMAIDIERAIRLFNVGGTTPPVWVTGHSLGGALAVALSCIFTFDGPKHRDIQGLYTYGQPRVCSPELVKALKHALGARFFRVVNNNDVVTRVPLRGVGITLYDDVGHVAHFDAQGDLTADSALHRKWMELKFQLIDELFSELRSHISDHFMNTNSTSYIPRLAAYAKKVADGTADLVFKD